MVVCLVMILGAFVYVFVPAPVLASNPHASPDCIACPTNPSICASSPDCKGGGCSPVNVAVDIYSVKTTPDSTSASLNWDESPAGSSTTVYWGNTTSYGFSQGVGGTGSYSVFLDYLEPASTYYYKIVAAPPASTCYIHYTTGTYTGSWATTTDSSTTISGTVYDSSTLGTAPANTIVEAWCVARPGLYAWGYTNAQGQYSLNVIGTNGAGMCQPYGSGGAQAYVVAFGYAQGGYWLGHWNESIIVWAPQVVNFYLPENFLSPTVVNYALFTNSGDVSLEFCKVTSSSYSYTTSSSATYGAFGLTGTATSSVEVGGSFSSGVCSTTVHEPSNEVWGFYMTTGMLLVNSIGGRAVTDVWMQYYGPQDGEGLALGDLSRIRFPNPRAPPLLASRVVSTGTRNWSGPTLKSKSPSAHPGPYRSSGATCLASTLAAFSPRSYSSQESARPHR
jgi:hypothetical protein